MTSSLEERPTKIKEGPPPHDVRLVPLETNPGFQCLREDTTGKGYHQSDDESH